MRRTRRPPLLPAEAAAWHQRAPPGSVRERPLIGGAALGWRSVQLRSLPAPHGRRHVAAPQQRHELPVAQNGDAIGKPNQSLQLRIELLPRQGLVLSHERQELIELPAKPARGNVRKPGGEVAEGERLRQFYRLTKPRVVSLIVFCAIIGMFLAAPGMVQPELLLAATVGIWLVAGAAAAVNCLVEQKIDAVMTRTRARPLPP